MRAVGVMVMALIAWGAWLAWPAPQEFPLSARTTVYALQAPMARRIVIGDSRVQWGTPQGDALFAGYGGATIADMERLTGTLCTLSSAEIVLALGTNDSKPVERDLPTSFTALQRMVDRCGADRVLLAEIWPGEPEKLPGGPFFDQQTIRDLNAGIHRIARASGARVIRAPDPVDEHTFDGIHFTDTASAEYMALLASSPGV